MTATGWVIFLAAFGVMAGLIGNEISQFQSWAPALTPPFIGKSLIHIGTVIGAFVGGKLIPTATRDGDVWTAQERHEFRVTQLEEKK